MAITLFESLRAVFYAPFYAGFGLGAYAAEGLDIRLGRPARDRHRDLRELWRLGPGPPPGAVNLRSGGEHHHLPQLRR